MKQVTDFMNESLNRLASTYKNRIKHCKVFYLCIFYCYNNTSRNDGLGLGDLKDMIEEVVIAADGLPAVSEKIREVCKQSEGLTRQQCDILRTSFRCNVCRGK